MRNLISTQATARCGHSAARRRKNPHARDLASHRGSQIHASSAGYQTNAGYCPKMSKSGHLQREIRTPQHREVPVKVNARPVEYWPKPATRSGKIGHRRRRP